MSFGGPASSSPSRGNALPYRMLAGVVPSRGGWLVMPGRLTGVTLYSMPPAVFPTLQDVMDWKPAFEIIAIHIPLGLPQDPASGGRACDREARELLGWPRRLSVMTPPTRRSLQAGSLDEARSLNGGMNPTTWQLAPKIAEAAREIASYNQRVIHEVHPELSFYELNGGVPMQYSKHRKEGREERRDLLVRKMQTMAHVIDTPVKGPTRAKILDACACLWSARRIAARGAAIRLPEIPEWDDEGVRMEIWR